MDLYRFQDALVRPAERLGFGFTCDEPFELFPPSYKRKGGQAGYAPAFLRSAGGRLSETGLDHSVDNPGGVEEYHQRAPSLVKRFE